MSVKNILPHEYYDDTRSVKLIESFKKVKYLANPIIVANLQKDIYIQLDGMNRLSTFKILNIPTILAQIIDYNNQESVELSSWIHLFGMQEDDFLERLKTVQGLNIKEGRMENISHRYVKEEGISRLATLVTKAGKVFLIYSQDVLLEKVKQLTLITDIYKERIVRDVLPPKPNTYDIDMLFRQHPTQNMISVFPTFTRHQIIKIVKKGVLFPSGITRHIISRRCLNVNIPIDVFTKYQSVDEQNEILKKILFEKRFRIYEEPIIYFE